MMQKKKKEYAVAVDAAKAAGKSHWGPTPLYELVTHKASAIEAMIFALLDDRAWEETFSELPLRFLAKARGIIVSCALTLQANFKMRVTDKTNSFPLLPFHLITAAPDVQCDDRKLAATTILNSTLEQDHSDFTIKLFELFKADFERMAMDGFAHRSSTLCYLRA